MKKLILSSTLIFAGFTLFSQSGEKWATGGNSGSASDFFGTTKSFPIIFKTSNVQRMSLGTNGILSVNFLSGTGNRLLQTDANGNIIPFAMGNANQVLYGNGAWGALPQVPTQLWQSNGNNITYYNGYVGIGTDAPEYELEVNGAGYFEQDLTVANNLYVGGGIVITNRMHANSEVKTVTLNADSIMMDTTKAIYGKTVVEGDVKLKFNLDVGGTTIFRGSNSVLGDQSITGNQDIQGNLIARQGLTFDGINGITFEPKPNGGGIYKYGNNNVALPYTLQCVNPDDPLPLGTPQNIHQIGGVMQLFDDSGPGGSYTSGGSIMNFQSWTTCSSIDVQGGVNPNTGAPGGGLLINYFCGKDTYINTGLNGGKVSMGKLVEIGSPYPSSTNTALNILGGSDFTGVNLVIDHTADYGYAFVTTVNRDYTKAIGVFNRAGGASVETFKVFGNGKTVIGEKTQNTIHADAMLTVYGKMVATSAYIRITDWADYVFDKDYKLPNLYDIEKYYKEYKRLPEIPSEKEVVENGIEIGEMNKLLLKKIEELTMQMVNMKKELDDLKTKIK